MSIGAESRSRRQAPTSRKTPKPIPTPPTTAQTNDQVTSPTLVPDATWPASPAAARAVRIDTRAVASLSSDSPSRMVVTRRGSPMRRATAVAATASGGATIAPSANAKGKEIGSSAIATRATPAAVKSTNPKDKLMIATRLAATSMSEVCIAAAYSSGGNRPTRTSSGDRLIVGTPGMNEMATPTTSSASGLGSRVDSASRATRMTVPTRAMTRMASSTSAILPAASPTAGRRLAGHPGRPSRRRGRACGSP